MRRNLVALFALFGALGGLVGIQVPATASGTGTPIILGPADGSQVAEGFADPISVDFTDAPVGTYSVDVVADGAGGSTYYDYEALGGVTTTDATTVWTKTLPVPIVKPGTYAVEVYGPTPDVVRSTFTIPGGDVPTVTSPADGAHRRAGFTGPIDVDLSGSPIGEYTVGVWSNDGTQVYDDSQTISNTNSTHVTAVYLSSPITHAGQYTIEVAGDERTGFADAAQSFSVYQLLTFGRASVSPATFYPRVRDGFRDRTRVSYRTNQRSELTAAVLNANGRRVVRHVIGFRNAGLRAWSWTGRLDNGSRADAGRYTIRITGIPGIGPKKSFTKTVHVAADTITRRRSLSRNGTNTSARSHRGNCFIDGFFGDLDLDCWGGRIAVATYRFAIPRTARNLNWSMGGRIGCCSNGRVTKSGSRTSSISYRVVVTVTGWREYLVRWVDLTYAYSVRR